MGGNSVDPLQITVTLEKVGENQLKAVVPAGATFDIVLPVSVSNGNLDESATTLSISKGSTESNTVTISRTSGTTAAVTANIGTLPSLPSNHYGYALSKSDTLPIEVIGVVSTTDTTDMTDTTDTMDNTDTLTNAAPVFADGSLTKRTISENTEAGVSIGNVVSATDADDDSLTYTLSGINADAFSIDEDTGQLKTKSALDYETKRIYVVSVNASDETLTATITVIISVIDRDDTPVVSTMLAVSDRTPQVRNAIVAAVPGVSAAASITETHLAAITTINLRNAGISELKTGDFSGLTGLTNLNLYGNILSSLPVGIFEGLTSLTTLRLGGNLLEPMPLIVSLQQVSDNQFQVVVHSGAPFDIVLSIGVTNGIMKNGETTITIPKGSLKSEPFTVVSTRASDAIGVSIGTLPSLPANHYGYILARSAVCNRTSQVADVIAAAVSGASDCNNVTDVDLATITLLDLSDMEITSLQSDDFKGLLSLTTLNLSNNLLESLPNGIFDSLTSLTTLDLGGNTVAPLPLTISIEKVGEDQIKAAVATGAPFEIVLPVNVANGSLSGSATTITVLQGRLESQPLTVNRTPDSYAAVTVDLGTLPNLPTNHSGYVLTKSNEFPLQIYSAINAPPVFTEGENTTRSIAENTEIGSNIGSAVTATDANNDTLNYTLSGTDVASFSINNSTGQLQTTVALDYETKDTYSVIITVSDGILTDNIDVTINITDIDETTTDVKDDTPNNAPVFTDGESTTRSVAENTGSGVNIGPPVSATDEDKDTLNYSLGGTDASSFSIGSTNGQLRTDAALDYETKTSYSVIITVADGNTGSDTISVTINITDVVEKTNTVPEFTEGSTTSRFVAENTGSGVDIGDAVSATDDDDDTLIYSLGGTDEASFGIDSSSGQLRTSASLDYETKSAYTITMTVSDGNGGSDSITITINITDVDETTNSAPVFSDGESATRSIAENTGSGVDIGSAVSATDADSDTLFYSLGGTDEASFSIDSSSGQLRTSASLDYETKSAYTVTISVSDGQGGSDSITVTIDVTDVDESPVNNAPVFTDGSSTTRNIAENTASNVNIGSAVSATDADDDTLSYSLGGTDESSFSIDSTTGQLKTKTTLNFETKNSYVVTVTVSDDQGGSTSINVTINVTNVNEAPVFTAGASTTRTIAENASAGINIGSAVSATDVDSTSLTYTLGGTNAASFDIESTSGQLKTKAALDYETKTSYSVTITVSDGSLTDSIAVTINVRDLDETPSNVAPVFTDGESTTRSIPENTAADAAIGDAVSATDADSENLAYLLSGTDASSFSVDADTGQLKTSAALDYETRTSYEVTITVSDGTLEDEITVTINVTNVNEAPVFSDGDSITRQVDENTAAGTNLGSVITATDPDANDTIIYSLGGTNAAAFDIGSTSGQLQTKAALDYEAKTSYTVTVTATDTGNATDTITVTITVTDVNEAPTFDGDSTIRSIAENTGSGVNIGAVVSATDPDTDDTLEYALAGTDAASFDIGSTNGQLRTKAALDYETKDSYSVTVTVTDGNGGTDSIAVTINVTDVHENTAPSFASESTTRSINENTGSGVNIGDAVSATDPDTNDTLEYTLGGTDAASFDIGSTNGQLRTKAALDYETKDAYSVTVSVSDGNGGTDSIAVTINVNDVHENTAPSFGTAESVTREVNENTGTGIDIGDKVEATDPDSDDTLEYSLGGTDASSFSIDSTSGQIRTNAALDYETKDSYSVTVSVTDGNGGTDSIAVTINITDVNEAPSFTENSPTTRLIAENTATDQNIGSVVSATDPDSGDSLTYGLGGTDAASFSIDSMSGQLKTKASLDHEDDDAYEVTVIVSDDDNLSASITVNISITDVNEAPSFTEVSPTTRSIEENTAAGQNIGSAVSATDPEGDTLEYTLEGADASSFSIVSTSGQLQTKSALDYETKTSYSVTVKVTDDTFTDTIVVTITVTDVSENTAPSFSENSFSYRISDIDNASVGDSIGDKVTATDADDDTLSYSLGGDDASLFDIDSSSGQLKITQSLIDHNSSLYSIKVIATDPDNATAEISGTIFVTRVARQETNNPPVFDDGESTTRSVAENTASGENIGTSVAATDDDAGDTLTYSLEGADAASFSIVSTSGQLQTSAALDYETKNTYSVTVKVTDDSGTSNNSDTIAVTINVTDVDPEGSITPVSQRTPAVRDAIVDSIEGVDDAADVTETHLAAITELDISFEDLTGLLSNDFDGLTGLTSLNMDGNKFSSLPVDIFDDLTSLTKLDISYNNFLHDDDNALTTLPDGIFDNLTSLVELDLSFSGLTSLPDGIFDQLSSLELLDLLVNEFTTLTADVFDGLTSLKRLDLATSSNESENQLTSIPSGLFDDLTSLEMLDLYEHSISSLPNGLFDNNTNLKKLILYNNGITTLPDGIFDELTSLTSLHFFGNDFDSLSEDIFENNTALETLNIAANEMTSISANIFDGLTSLNSLSIENNKLTTLPAGILDDLTSLTKLTLRSNNLTGLPDDVFNNNTNLIGLNIGNNNISSLQANLFSNLNNLAYLDMSYNNISSLPDGIFVGLTSLTSFECEHQGENSEFDSIAIKVGLEKVAEGQFKVVCPTGLPIVYNRIIIPISNGKVHPDEDSAYIVTLNNKSPTIRIPVGESESDAISVVRLDDTTDAVTVSIYDIYYGYSLSNHGYYFVIDNSNLPLELIPTVSGAPNNPQQIPEETALLSNYPNPFNPETWIPYQLSKSAGVSITIYGMQGTVIRKLELGQKPAGYYIDRKRAAYWDGRNALGEKVAAGVYFITFKAGDYTATRKILIRK